MHAELDFRPVQIITGHVIYNSPYKYWPDENDQDKQFLSTTEREETFLELQIWTRIQNTVKKLVLN